MSKKNTETTPEVTEGQTTIEDAAAETAEVAEVAETTPENIEGDGFTLIAEDEVPATTRQSNGKYRKMLTLFAESTLSTVKVSMPENTPSQVYNGLRTALRHAKTVRDAGVKVQRRNDDGTMVVYLTK